MDQATMERNDQDTGWILTMGSIRETIKMNPTSGLWTCGMYNANFDLSSMIETIMLAHDIDPATQDVYAEAIDRDFPEEEEYDMHCHKCGKGIDHTDEVRLWNGDAETLYCQKCADDLGVTYDDVAEEYVETMEKTKKPMRSITQEFMDATYVYDKDTAEIVIDHECDKVAAVRGHNGYFSMVRLALLMDRWNNGDFEGRITVMSVYICNSVTEKDLWSASISNTRTYICEGVSKLEAMVLASNHLMQLALDKD